MSTQIIAAANYYGVSPEAVAGAIALEQNNAQQFGNLKLGASLLAADYILSTYFSSTMAYPPIDPSTSIARDYVNSIGSVNIGSQPGSKLLNPILDDMGPAGFKLQLAIQIVLNNQSDPTFAPYVNNFYGLAVDLNSGSNLQLTASLVAANLQLGTQFFQTHLGPLDNPQDGADAWNALGSSQQNALLDQYYNQGQPFLLQPGATISR